MKTVKDNHNFIAEKAAAFLKEKPMWVWWIFYVILTGLLFSLFYFVFYLLGIQRVIGVLILIATGIIWGSVKYMRRKGKNTEEKKEAEE